MKFYARRKGNKFATSLNSKCRTNSRTKSKNKGNYKAEINCELDNVKQNRKYIENKGGLRKTFQLRV